LGILVEHSYTGGQVFSARAEAPFIKEVTIMPGKSSFSKLILPMGLVLVFMLPFLTMNATGDILSDRQQIESLIEAGKLTEAQTQIEQFKADYSQDSGLPDALYLIAHRYRLEHKWEQAINLYNQIIQDYPDSPSASRATLGIARVGVLSLLVAKDYDGAQQALDKLVVDFRGHPDLPETLCKIAEGFRWGHRWEQSRNLYKQVKQDYPNTLYASRADLAIANLEVVSSLVAQNYTAAQKSLDEMINSFPDHPDLPETLYWIAQGYRWAHKWQEAKNIYQQITKNHPDSSFADRARVGLSKVEVLSLIASRNFDQAEKALDKLIADFAGHPDLPNTLYGIAEGYRLSDKYEIAKELYGRIIQEYPESSVATKARQQFKVVVEEMDVFVLIESGREQEAQDAINKLIANPADNEISAYTVFLCGDRYYAKGLQKTGQGLKDEAAANFTKAIDIWQNMIQQLPASGAAPEGYYHLALAYSEIGEYALAIENYTKVVEDYPDYRFTWDAQFRTGHTYEKMVNAGLLSESEAKPLIASAYQKLLEKHPDCQAVNAARHWLEKSGNYTRSEGNAVVDGNDVD
jgi:TolA-binding protein